MVYLVAVLQVLEDVDAKAEVAEAFLVTGGAPLGSQEGPSGRAEEEVKTPPAVLDNGAKQGRISPRTQMSIYLLSAPL